MVPGVRNKLGVPCEQMYCIEESTCDIVGTFWRPQYFVAQAIVRPSMRSCSERLEFCTNGKSLDVRFSLQLLPFKNKLAHV